ncbi:hypothetical protein AB1Y20_021038 [Prymnesium parvum]|uniref:mRNA export factor GLE1 n=1 Tax=Prymnesium parvum TaxID=97485 RepID=A0AB34JKD5_PRYPA
MTLRLSEAELHLDSTDVVLDHLLHCLSQLSFEPTAAAAAAAVPTDVRRSTPPLDADARVAAALASRRAQLREAHRVAFGVPPSGARAALLRSVGEELRGAHEAGVRAAAGVDEILAKARARRARREAAAAAAPPAAPPPPPPPPPVEPQPAAASAEEGEREAAAQACERLREAAQQRDGARLHDALERAEKHRGALPDEAALAQAAAALRGLQAALQGPLDEAIASRQLASLRTALRPFADGAPAWSGEGLARAVAAARQLAAALESSQEELRAALSRAEAADASGAAVEELRAAAAAAAVAGVRDDEPLLLRAAAALAAAAPPPPRAVEAAAGGETTAAGLEAEWLEARALVQQAEGMKRSGGRTAQQVSNLVGQVARVHSVVWEKGVAIAELLEELRAQGPAPLGAGCAAFAKRLVGMTAMMVEKQPGMAFALASLTLLAGDHEPLLWQCVHAHLRAACCYAVPHFVRRPPSGSLDEWKDELGYARRGDGKGHESKEQYYNRMRGYITMYGALLQVQRVPLFNPPSEQMELRPATNPLGTRTAWAWLARMLNQKPQRISASLLHAFLVPTAHALHASYPRQFRKVLRVMQDKYIPKLRETVCGGEGTEHGAEERGAVSVLESFVEEALAAIAGGRGPEVPKAADMLVFKAPDDTREVQDDSW